MAAYPEIKMYIGGSWRKRAGAEVINPFDETVLGTVPHATRADLDDALEAAERGFKVWSRMSPAERARIILKAAEIIHSRSAGMGEIMTMEQGKTIDNARLEVARCQPAAEWAANEGKRLYGRIVPSDRGQRNMVFRQPMGVAAAFTPWNYPVSSPAGKIASTLAAGCAVILKAAEETPAGAMQVVEAYHEAGVPPGVVNLVFGIPADISGYLIPHPAIKVITFTGSVPVGKRLAELTGRHMKQAVMELGGHSPVIVCDDVDPVAVAAESIMMKTRNAGQICVSPTRFYVHEKVFGQFTEALVAKAKAVKLGNGLDPSVGMGPLANARRLEAVEALVADAMAKGATRHVGGERIGNRGFLYPLTVLTDVPETANTMNEEPFGPIALVNPVKSIDEAIQRSNRLPYGLAGYAFTRSAVYAEQIMDGLEVGNIGINHYISTGAGMPFGGIKDSGFGREGGIEGISNYTSIKGVSHKIDFPGLN
jgi:succinate-semialdehyde dehydrogenase/glutarate-semialdehyde dehydrogenase